MWATAPENSTFISVLHVREAFIGVFTDVCVFTDVKGSVQRLLSFKVLLHGSLIGVIRFTTH